MESLRAWRAWGDLEAWGAWGDWGVWKIKCEEPGDWGESGNGLKGISNITFCTTKGDHWHCRPVDLYYQSLHFFLSKIESILEAKPKMYYAGMMP